MGHKGVLRFTGPYIVHCQLHDTTYQLRELDGTVMWGSVTANCSKVFYYREEHQMVHTVQCAKFALHTAMTSSSSTHAATVIGTLNQDLLITLPYLFSVKFGDISLADNRSLVYLSTITPSAYTLSNLHHRFYPTIAELDLNNNNPIRYICYTASSSVFLGHIHETLLKSSNICNLEAWVLDALPLC